MRRNFRLLVISLFFVALVLGIFNLNQLRQVNKQISDLEGALGTLQKDQASTTSVINRNQSLRGPGVPNTGGNNGLSQDALITNAVEKAAPSVVSIIISKNVPDLEVKYINPFGNDPIFKNFNFKIPVYRQKGNSDQKLGSGSGFIISHNGHIVTNRHVVNDREADYTVLLSNGEQKKASVVYRDANSDVAVLKIDGTYGTVATIGNSSEVKLGQAVVAIGNALGEYENSVSVGIISGLNRTVQAYDITGTQSEELKGVFQTDASINLGNSGGPLIDLNGNVIGVNVATIYGSNNISFAIPIDELKGALGRFIQI